MQQITVNMIKRIKFSRLHPAYSRNLRTKDEEEVNGFDEKSQHKQKAHVKWRERSGLHVCLPAGQMNMYVNPFRGCELFF